MTEWKRIDQIPIQMLYHSPNSITFESFVYFILTTQIICSLEIEYRIVLMIANRANVSPHPSPLPNACLPCTMQGSGPAGRQGERVGVRGKFVIIQA